MSGVERKGKGGKTDIRLFVRARLVASLALSTVLLHLFKPYSQVAMWLKWKQSCSPKDLCSQCRFILYMFLCHSLASGLFRQSQTNRLFSAISLLFQTLQNYLLLVWKEVKGSSRGLVYSKKEDCNQIIYVYTVFSSYCKCPRVPVRHSRLDLESDVASAAFKKKNNKKYLTEILKSNIFFKHIRSDGDRFSFSFFNGCKSTSYRQCVTSIWPESKHNPRTTHVIHKISSAAHFLISSG